MRRFLFATMVGALMASSTASGLVASIGVSSPKVFVAEPIYYWVTLLNETDVDQYVAYPALLPTALTLRDPGGEKVPLASYQPDFKLTAEAAYRRIRPGERFSCVGDLSELFRLAKEGSYVLSLYAQNASPDRFVEGKPGAGAGAPPPSLIVQGPIAAAGVAFVVERESNNEVADVIDRIVKRSGDGALSPVLSRNAEELARRFPSSGYSAAVGAAMLERLMAGMIPRHRTARDRFGVAARMMDQLESAYPQWHGWPYLYAHAIAQAEAKGETAYAAKWETKLQTLSQGHPVLDWLSSQRSVLNSSPKSE